jgi:hypothetical protein
MTTLLPTAIPIQFPRVATMLLAASSLFLCGIPAIAQPAQSNYHATTNKAIVPPSNVPNPGGFPPPPTGNPGKIPSGIIPLKCGRMPPGEMMVDCYLSDASNNTPSGIAGVMWWYFYDTNQILSWKDWPTWAKKDLGAAFQNTVDWYNGGMVKYNGALVAEPPTDIVASIVMQKNPPPTTTALEPSVAWQIYIGHVALNLAAEIYRWVPWSLHNYNGTALSSLLSTYSEFWYCTQGGISGYCLSTHDTPGNAISSFKFLKTNNLIGATRIDTIRRVLDWTRANLRHMGGNYTYEQYFYYWQYWGAPPISRMLSGTNTTDPAMPSWWATPRHWTPGCFGTSAFLLWILKAAGIPVEEVMAGYHTTPYFVGENLYLSHGDDASFGGPTNYPTYMLLIDAPTYNTWFPANNPVQGNTNVGRRPVQISLQFPNDPYIMNPYCVDLQTGKTHATGWVYNEFFKQYYDLQYLENAGLWQRLDQIVATQGCAI